MLTNLFGKQILFFGPATFNYEKEIVSELENAGAKVSYRSDKPGTSFFLKVILRLFPKVLWRYSDYIFGRWLRENGPSCCDFVLVIKGEGLSPRFLDLLKVKYKNAIFILYLWDSVKNVRYIEPKLKRFDRIYSFDPNDCRRFPEFKYRPLFYLDRYREHPTTHGSGCFFIGTLNGDRPAVISRILISLPVEAQFDYWLFVRNDIELFLRRIFDSSLRTLATSRLIRTPMPYPIVIEHFKNSTAIVDIEHHHQIGLTMRTFEVLAAGKKLITTNKNIASHDFYHPSRICIIDRKTPQLSVEFLNSVPEPLSEKFYEKYSLRGWMTEVFDLAVPIEGDWNHD